MQSSERQIEMLWRCTSCQNKNLGRYKICQTCHNPKDGSEEFEMPEDTSKAATVTEASLLRMATAGPDWRCAYCGSDQRRLDMGCNNCGASAVEGAEVPDAPAQRQPGAIPKSFTRSGPQYRPGSRAGAYWLIGIVVVIALLCTIGPIRRWNRNRPHDYKATVSAVFWERDIIVERYQISTGEAFKETLPSDAFAIKSVGQKVHHHEQILDGYDTEHYSVDVPDGYRTESYSEQVSCGQDCQPVPQTCQEKCTSNKNGFATCRNECTGGGQRCSTRYCTEMRTRQIPKTRSESRTRQVPRYRSEPRYAEGFSYKRWGWQPARKLHAQGDALPATWPEANLGKDLGPGEKEREQRHQSYKVTFTYGKPENAIAIEPKTEEAFAQFPLSSEHRLHTEKGRFILDGVEITPRRVLK